MPWTTATTRATGFGITAAIWNAEVVDNMNYLKEIDAASVTSDVAVTATTAATATTVISLAAKTYEAVPTLLEFYCPRLDSANVTHFILLQDGATVVGTWARAVTNTSYPGVYLWRRFTPTAASHTYKVTAYNGSAGTWTYNAGTGGTAGDGTTDLEISMRATRIPT